jgi:hypothetical protein
MSEILAIFGSRTSRGYYLILDCGHWYHWDGKRPRVGTSLDCPSCKPLPTVVPMEES